MVKALMAYGKTVAESAVYTQTKEGNIKIGDH
jgi:hypothetical protein